MSTTSDEKQKKEKFRQEMGTMFLKHRGLALQAALRIIGDGKDAEDAVQNVFTRLIERRSLQSEFCENPAGYLYRSVVNEAMDLFRARQSQKLAGEDIDTLQILAPEPDWVREYNLERIREAMNTIQPDFIEILTMYYTEGYSCLEIANIRTKELDAAIKELWRARKALKKAIRLQEKQRETQKAKHQRDRRQASAQI